MDIKGSPVKLTEIKRPKKDSIVKRKDWGLADGE